MFLLRDNIARSEMEIVKEITSISLGGLDSKVILALSGFSKLEMVRLLFIVH